MTESIFRHESRFDMSPGQNNITRTEQYLLQAQRYRSVCEQTQNSRLQMEMGQPFPEQALAS